ncbi:MAG: hypothetical protein KA067_02075 [Prevotella sp.]|nr:hypothetical protein [Prevotella sp.]
MSGKKDKHVAAHAVNNVEHQKRRADRQERQQKQGDAVIKWVFGGLIFLAILFMIYSFYVI